MTKLSRMMKSGSSKRLPTIALVAALGALALPACGDCVLDVLGSYTVTLAEGGSTAFTFAAPTNLAPVDSGEPVFTGRCVIGGDAQYEVSMQRPAGATEDGLEQVALSGALGPEVSATTTATVIGVDYSGTCSGMARKDAGADLELVLDCTLAAAGESDLSASVDISFNGCERD